MFSSRITKTVSSPAIVPNTSGGVLLSISYARLPAYPGLVLITDKFPEKLMEMNPPGICRSGFSDSFSCINLPILPISGIIYTYEPSLPGTLAILNCFRSRDKVACVKSNPNSCNFFKISSWLFTLEWIIISLIACKRATLFFMPMIYLNNYAANIV